MLQNTPSHWRIHQFCVISGTDNLMFYFSCKTINYPQLRKFPHAPRPFTPSVPMVQQHTSTHTAPHSRIYLWLSGLPVNLSSGRNRTFTWGVIILMWQFSCNFKYAGETCSVVLPFSGFFVFWLFLLYIKLRSKFCHLFPWHYHIALMLYSSPSY